ncbi:MAG: hydantoinase B/oxoprolinase family protein, partial [Bacteroidota bacterium]
LGIKERISSEGEVLTQIEAAETKRMIEWALAGQFDAIAITLLNSYRNPEHERLLAEALASSVPAKVVCSHELISSVKLLPRAETTVVNAYLAPVIDRYLANIRHALGEIDFKIMTSAGGLVSAEQFHAKDSLLSGPAGGVVGAAALAEACGYPRVLTLDMGGTSTDVAKYQETLAYEHETQVGPAKLLAPTLAVHTVAAGGGSICGFDGQKLWVGPESASAWPGPACYGAGGPLTLTDVNLLLGRLDPQTVGIPLDLDAARMALRKVLQGSQLDEKEALRGWLDIANETMAGAIRKISVEKGYDPQAYSLLAFGGAGGMHVAEVAESLGVRQILVPYDAGIMSAVGIHQAQLEGFAHVQVLQPWHTIQTQLDDWIDPLKQSVQHKLQAEGLEPAELEAPRVWLFLRFEGQDHSLELAYQSGLDVEAEFEIQYRKLYGHWLENRALELEAIKVGGRQKGGALPRYGVPDSGPEKKPDAHGAAYPVFYWENQSPGQGWKGPVLLAAPLGTTFIPQGWTGRLDEGLNLRMSKVKANRVEEPSTERAAAIELELFTRRFQSVAEEMGALLQRSSFSVNIKERLDFSCALLDAEGYLVANAPHIPVHLGSLGVCTRLVKAALPLGPGDVAITNHPGYGGSHLPDVTLIAPVYDEEAQLLGYLANRAHHAEIGGKRPGSMPPDAHRLAEEGVVIAPQYLLQAGEARWEAMRALFTQGPYPSRSVEENLADLRAALASIKAGEAALQALSSQHGRNKVQAYMQGLKEYAARRLREQVANRPQGTFSAQEKLDDGTPLTVSWGFEKDQVTVDFTGSGEVHPLNFNANLAIVNSAVLYVLRLLLAEDLPLNEGLMMPVRVVLPPGLLNPSFDDDPALCPAVVGGNVETSQRLIDALLKPLDLLAASQGTMNNLLFGHDQLGYYETIGGGTGAGPGFAGAH